ncbi:hypothetical protein BDW72DRAFT_205992 [Aspergillus terricola var. indicus]
MAENSPYLGNVNSGGTGLVGAAITDAFAKRHPECAITPLDLHPPGPAHLVPDTANAASIVPDLAGRLGWRLKTHVWRVNFQGKGNLLDAAKRNGSETIRLHKYLLRSDGLSGSPFVQYRRALARPSYALIYRASKLSGRRNTYMRSRSPASVPCGPGDYQVVPAIHAPFFIQDNEPITVKDFCLTIWAHSALACFAGLAVSETLTWVLGQAPTLSRGRVKDACATHLGDEARISFEDGIA